MSSDGLNAKYQVHLKQGSSHFIAEVSSTNAHSAKEATVRQHPDAMVMAVEKEEINVESQTLETVLIEGVIPGREHEVPRGENNDTPTKAEQWQKPEQPAPVPVDWGKGEIGVPLSSQILYFLGGGIIMFGVAIALLSMDVLSSMGFAVGVLPMIFGSLVSGMVLIALGQIVSHLNTLSERAKRIYQALDKRD